MSAAVILAAGAGRRLGTVAKATLVLADGRTYLEAVRDIGRAAGVERFVVVVGPPHDPVTRAHALELGLATAYNPAPERGMASSVAIGFEHALAHFDADAVALLWPVDHARVSPATVAQVLARADRSRAVIPTHAGRGGHPTAFGRALWPALGACAGAPEGARSVLRALAARSAVVRIDVADPGVLADVDTPDDRERAVSDTLDYP